MAAEMLGMVGFITLGWFYYNAPVSITFYN